ncbi:hypothetical protein AGMMS50293_16370 [Spirochaetia bacterium]|nr:hypothetical protein AGMMS50293_16370 [Spirochaetia bacterium]
MGMGIVETITSPTYTIITEYQGSLPLYHIDVYRLNSDEDFENLGGTELLYGSGVSVVEWSERIPHSLPPETITIAITISGPESRVLRISGPAEMEHSLGKGGAL